MKKMKTNLQQNTYSIGILDVIQIVLVMLKGFDLIDTSWWLVFLPLYIEVGLILIFWGVITLIRMARKRKLNKENNK